MRNFIVCTVHLMWLNPEDYDGLFIHFCVEEGRSLSKFEQINLQEIRLLGRPRRRWEDNISMYLCPAHLNFLDLITLTIVRESYKL